MAFVVGFLLTSVSPPSTIPCETIETLSVIGWYNSRKNINFWHFHSHIFCINSLVICDVMIRLRCRIIHTHIFRGSLEKIWMLSLREQKIYHNRSRIGYHNAWLWFLIRLDMGIVGTIRVHLFFVRKFEHFAGLKSHTTNDVAICFAKRYASHVSSN